MLQSLWKIIQCFFIKLNIELSNDPGIPLQGIMSKRTKSQACLQSHPCHPAAVPSTTSCPAEGASLTVKGRAFPQASCFKWSQGAALQLGLGRDTSQASSMKTNEVRSLAVVTCTEI